ncbi:MAG: AAA family ATPase, partial [Elusimicrobiales bacterium]|nr:AAA family ATPase [Elusimicrobiales bacterium]
EKNKDNPLTQDVVIIDEASMVDILLMDNLLKAISKKTSLIFVGDCNQLPSVSPGKVLKDLMDKRYCPVYELKKIQRQAADSSIVRAAHAVYEGQKIHFSYKKDDLYFIEIDDPEEIAEFIKLAVEDGRYGQIETIQVLSPTKKGPVGTERLNEMLKKVCREKNLKVLRERGFIREGEKEHIPADPHKKFAIGDKVIQLENNYEKDVFNGEIGYIIAINEKDGIIKILFDNKEVIYHDYDMDQIGLAYALTVHKFQGSEAECVIMPVTTSQYMMLFRNLFYTAITRAKKRLCLVGTHKALNIAIKNNRQVIRYSDFV